MEGSDIPLLLNAVGNITCFSIRKAATYEQKSNFKPHQSCRVKWKNDLCRFVEHQSEDDLCGAGIAQHIFMKCNTPLMLLHFFYLFLFFVDHLLQNVNVLPNIHLSFNIFSYLLSKRWAWVMLMHTLHLYMRRRHS